MTPKSPQLGAPTWRGVSKPWSAKFSPELTPSSASGQQVRERPEVIYCSAVCRTPHGEATDSTVEKQTVEEPTDDACYKRHDPSMLHLACMLCRHSFEYERDSGFTRRPSKSA